MCLKCLKLRTQNNIVINDHFQKLAESINAMRDQNESIKQSTVSIVNDLKERKEQAIQTIRNYNKDNTQVMDSFVNQQINRIND